MAPTFYPSTEALVAFRVPASALPIELRIVEAESALEAAERVAAMRGRDLDAAPSEQALRLARWAFEELRDAREHLEALRAEAAR